MRITAEIESSVFASQVSLCFYADGKAVSRCDTSGDFAGRVKIELARLNALDEEIKRAAALAAPETAK